MIRFLLKVIFFFLFVIFVIYLFESGMMKKGWNYLSRKINVEKVIDKGEKKIKEEIKKRVEGKKLLHKQEVEKYPEEERKRIEEMIKKGSP